MPLALVIIAMLAILTGIKGNYQDVGTAFQQDVASKGGFIAWAGAIIGIALLFRMIQAPNAGRLFIALVLISFFLQNTTVISEIDAAITGAPTPTAPPSPTATSPAAPSAPAAPVAPATPGT